MTSPLTRLLGRVRRAVARVRWKELAPVLVLAVVLVVIAAVVGLGKVGGPDQTATSPGSPSASPSGSLSASTAPSGPPSVSPSGSGASSGSGRPGHSSGGSTLDPSSLPTVTGCLSPRRLTVMTFNIHGAINYRGVNLRQVAAEVRAAKADVVLLQEVDRFRRRTGFRDEPSILANLLGMHAVFGSNVVRPAPGPGRPRQLYGTAMLSRYPIESSSNTHLPNRPGLEQRGLLHATIVVDGQPVNVFGTHLQYTSESIRLVQIRAIKRLMAGTTGPVILGGDLNAHVGGPVIRTARSFLTDSWPEAGRGPGLTVPERHPRGRIDYLFHNDWLTARAAQVMPSAISDHRSLRVVFDVWPAAGCGD